MPAPAAPPAVPPGPPRLRLDDKLLSFEFRLLDAQFNEPGRYQLHLRVENPLLDNSVEGVTVKVKNGDMIQGNQAETDIAEQGDLTDTLAFDKNIFLFVLPKGLCKNDKHHDVRLSIDVLKFGSGLLKSSKIVGQALFAIYPRTNQPRINLRAAPFEPLYNYQGVLALLRVGGDQMAMHCGRLAYNVCFREYQPPKIEEIPESSSPIPSILRTGNSQPGTPRTDQFQQSIHQNITPRVPTPKSSILKPQTSRSIPIQTETSTPRSHHNIPSIPIDQESEEYDSSDEEGRYNVSSQGGYSQKDRDDAKDETQRILPPSTTHKAPNDAPLRLPSPPKTPASLKKTHVSEKPPTQGDPVLGADRENKLLPLQGMEKIVVTLHSARNIPSNSAGSAPSPFVSLMSSTDEKTGTAAQNVSHAANTPTNSPIWGETLMMTVKEEEADQQDLILTVADNPSQEFLLDYRLPIHMLQPFHPYHLCLVQPHDQGDGECHLYISIERRSSSIAQQSAFTYNALQVLLVGIESPLQGQSHPLLAVARIVPNYKDYSQSHKPPGMSGVPHVSAKFPDPSPSLFLVPQRATQGQPQISSPGLPPSHPIWNSSYLFQGRDGVTLFSEGAALVLEYYPVTSESRRVPWHLSHYCGFSVIPLDMEIYHKLMSGSSNNALTLTSVPIQETELKTVSGGSPSVSLQLLLLKSEHPEIFLNPSEIQSTEHQHPTNIANESPRNAASMGELHQDGPSLPPYNALADILPVPWIQQTPKEQKPADATGLQKVANTSLSQQYLSNNVELPADPVMEHQEQELSNYRLAMQRMADDIIALRRQMSGLEAENSALRSERSLNQDLGRSLLSDTDIDVMTKAELADRLVTLKQKLASETSELRGIRDRVQQLQNELVRRNDREKELLLLQRAHQQQQAVLNQYHQRLSRAKNLQDTVRKQEKVIEKMEKLLDNKLRDEKKNRADKGDRGARVETLQGEVYAALLAENTRLRGELDNARQPTVLTQIHPVPDPLTDSEKFALLSKLERSQARVQSLERELEDSARRWGRDKQQLLTQISEQQMGFSRTQTTILHHFPTKDRDPPTKRHTKLDPLI
ncbi:coiled-coil domain-containing protein 33 [Mantella aurantiaca]